ncbi:ABC transporter substrate-binding protein [Paenibacillus harenae]|uniref:ABC transporter substrate-binding protein n=1 Tax=Paenibacillus harenae TaxID=306543 RepID=UPI000A047816|nr:ABC transporter substrate-binding protein [Paenibacillus harenae]
MWMKRKLAMIATAALAVMLVAAGCGNNGNTGNEGGNSGAVNTNSGESDGAAYPVTIKHAKGETVLEEKPMTAAITYFPYAEHLFAIGEESVVGGVVGLTALQNFTVYEPYVMDKPIADLGDETNLEQITALNPDVIIAWEADDAQYDQLSKIADTIVINSNENWQETIVQVAAVFSAEEKAEQYIQDYEAKLKEVAALMDTTGEKGKSALFVMTWGKGFNYYGGARMAPYYEHLGFKSFDTLEDYGEIGLEGVSELDPDYIFLGKDFTNSAETQLEELEKNPVWNRLKAVKSGKVFIVDTEILGPLAMGQSKGLTFMESIMTNGNS